MKIWLDTTLPSQQDLIDGCDGSDDGGCDDPSYRGGQSVLHIQEVGYSVQGHTLVSSESLHIQPCGDELWLVCNPVESGSVAVMDTDAYALLQRFAVPKTMQEVTDQPLESSPGTARALALLARSGFLLDLDQPTSAPGEESQMLTAWLHITNSCNLGCHYCYIHKTSEHMLDTTAKQAVDAIVRSAVSNHYQYVMLKYAGGEASLRLQQVLATHDYAAQQCREHGLILSASLLSNGVMLSQRAIEQLKQRHIRLMISLDGVGEGHDKQRPMVGGKGSFTFIDRTITRLLDNQLAPFINVVVSQRNIDGLPDLLAYILQRDLSFRLSYYRENEYSARLTDLQFAEEQMIRGMRSAFAYIEDHLPRRQIFSSLIDKANMQAPHQHTCGAGRNYLVVDQRGGIAKCHADITQTITTIDAANPLQVIRQHQKGMQAVAVDQKEGCRTCEWRYWCSGGCPTLTYRLTGRNDIQSPNCAIYKAFFPEAVRLEGLRLLRYESPIAL